MTSPRCWKGCGQIGDFWHCWWDCPVLQIFWKAIIHHVFKISSHKVLLCPRILLLDLWPDSSIPISTRNLISLLFLAAKCVVARKWKNPRPPTIKDWYIKIWDLLIADKLSEGILSSENNVQRTTFLDKWFPFLDYLHNAKYVASWRPRRYRFISLY